MQTCLVLATLLRLMVNGALFFQAALFRLVVNGALFHTAPKRPESASCAFTTKSGERPSYAWLTLAKAVMNAKRPECMAQIQISRASRVPSSNDLKCLFIFFLCSSLTWGEVWRLKSSRQFVNIQRLVCQQCCQTSQVIVLSRIGTRIFSETFPFRYGTSFRRVHPKTALREFWACLCELRCRRITGRGSEPVHSCAPL